MAKKIELIFKNEAGKNVVLSLDNPFEPVNPALVAQVMEQVIAENAFISSGGALVSKHAARIVERNVSDIQI
ncbi:DUF2922 domain-containing protein [Anaerobacillus sp. CMMVII]|uniref:DUF2922 domain-containing protein n=1 Tax=Anaerobacillus sp. CMMVII TaxID=2755588 RepID=UPI0021B82A40|nr:DUF2922 domain-containing protein [Anaerobacillus sp. CMMVII]MCT8137564.1 DUF2922 domain-containing protein [Anaerobacillus sp. CMMVII]MCT8137589.1 DUF2922 domain-containing protein [Anaerobacillus sp. CMMVII]MCT8139137.1 DUF2922 domain-containing protein [Anaerobacillus sp. CMMVII]